MRRDRGARIGGAVREGAKAMATSGDGASTPAVGEAISSKPQWWRTAVPLALAVALAFLPAPPGLAQHA
jgi:hypothetical protein